MSVILMRRTSLLTAICQWYWWGEQAYKQQYVSDIDENKLTYNNMSVILMRRTSLLTAICQWYWWGEQAY